MLNKYIKFNFGGKRCGTSTIVDIRRLKVKGVEWRGMDWIDLDQDGEWWLAVVNVVMNFRVPVGNLPAPTAHTNTRL